MPNVCATTEGSSSNAFPWGRGSMGLLHQAIYDSSHFTGQGVTYPIVIMGVKWRPNANIALAATSYPTPCSVRCSTCPIDWSAVSTTLANQRGADETLCFQGPVSFAAQAPQAGPTTFGIDIPFTTAFPYDPNLGDLNIECDLPVQTGYVGGTPLPDVHSGVQASASRVFASAGYTGYPGTTAFGTTVDHAVVIEITYTPASGYSYSTGYGTGCGNAADTSSYEHFATSAAFDLGNSGISLINVGTGYLAVPGSVGFVPPPPLAIPLSLADDSEETIMLSQPMPVGASNSTTMLTIRSNGFVSGGP
ncbi:MAG TPA: hypothetical protein VF384_07170 [Planctomycetota bacterium]